VEREAVGRASDSRSVHTTAMEVTDGCDAHDM